MFINKIILSKAQNKTNIIFSNNVNNYFNIIKNEFLDIWKEANENNLFLFEEFKPYFDIKCVHIIDEFSIKITHIYSKEFNIYEKITPIILYTINNNKNFVELTFKDMKNKITIDAYKIIYEKNNSKFDIDKNNVLDNILINFELACVISLVGKYGFREQVTYFNGKNMIKYF